MNFDNGCEPKCAEFIRMKRENETLRSVKTVYRHCQKENTELLEMNECLGEENAKLQKENEGFKKENDELQAERNELKNRNEMLRIAELEKENEDLKGSEDIAQYWLTVKKEENEELKKENEGLKIAVDDIATKAENLEYTLQYVRHNAADLVKDNFRLSERNKSLEDIVQDQSQEIENLESLLEPDDDIDDEEHPYFEEVCRMYVMMFD